MSSRANRLAVCFLVVSWLFTPAWAQGADLAFRRHVLDAKAQFVAAAAFDVNHDGKIDIICGDSWYEGPAFTKKHPVRTVEIINGRPDGFAHLQVDVNGDGWMDIITANWRSRSIKWIEHPGAGLGPWKTHVIAEPGNMETGRLVDMFGDGNLHILPNGSNFSAWWEIVRTPNPAGGFTASFVRHELPREVQGHGQGFGDINGDGRGDIIGRFGWAEAPEDRRKGRWVWHADFDLDQASIPVLVADVNGDGLNDLVFSRAHHYGIYWLEQQRGQDKSIQWVKHVIDTSWAGGHTPVWDDLDGDGQPELILGKRYMAHEGADPGEYEPLCIYRYQYDKATKVWKRGVVTYNEQVGFGLDPKIVDLNGDGRKDVLTADRDGFYWLENLGPAPAGTVVRNASQAPSYADRTKLLVVKDDAGQERPMKTAFDLGLRRMHILASIEKVLGLLPDSSSRVPLDVQVVSETPAEGYVRKKITFAADQAGRVPAYLLVPQRTGKRPAMLCLHDATSTAKDEPAGVGGRPAMRYAHELAQKGYVCIVPDYPSFGEYSYDFTKVNTAYGSGAMKAVWNNIRALDVLEAMPAVDANRIGCIGHGQGGTGALLTAAFDYRVTATVTSCGFTSFARYKGGNLADWAHERYMPRIREQFGSDPAKVPFDFAEVLAALAPRQVYVSSPLKDEVSDVEGVKSSVAAAQAVYQLRSSAGGRGGGRGGAGGQNAGINVVHPDVGRDFPDDVRNDVYAWLARLLRP